MKRLTSLRALGKAIGRSHTSARRWVNHDLWEWSRTGPWDGDDVPAMVAWAEDVLADDPAADARPARRMVRPPTWTAALVGKYLPDFLPAFAPVLPHLLPRDLDPIAREWTAVTAHVVKERGWARASEEAAIEMLARGFLCVLVAHLDAHLGRRLWVPMLAAEDRAMAKALPDFRKPPPTRKAAQR